MTTPIRPSALPEYSFALLIAFFGVAVAWTMTSRGMPTPVYLDYVHILLSGGTLAESFMPSGYPALLAPGVALAGDYYGVLLIQTVAYITTVLLAWTLLRWAGLSQRAAVIGTLIIAFHPYMILNINRITYNAIAPPFMLALLASVWFPDRMARGWRPLFLGVATGALFLARPNILSVMPIVLGVLALYAPKRGLGLALLGMASGFAGLSFYAAGQPFNWPTNGPYNLFGGFNPLTEAALWQHMHVEPSIAAALSLHGITTDVYQVPNSTYSALAKEFVVQQPLETIKGFFIKALTLIRPDYRTATGTIALAVQTLLVIPLPLWLAVMAWRKLNDGGGTGLRTILLIAFYLAPFVVINADPRYRHLADLVILLHLVIMIARPGNAQSDGTNHPAR